MNHIFFFFDNLQTISETRTDWLHDYRMCVDTYAVYFILIWSIKLPLNYIEQLFLITKTYPFTLHTKNSKNHDNFTFIMNTLILYYSD